MALNTKAAMLAGNKIKPMRKEYNHMARKTAEAKAGKYSELDTWNKKGDLKEGDNLEGYYVDKDTFNTKFGEMVIFVIEKLDGTLIKVAGQSNIKNKFEDIPEGSHVWIKYAGLTETKNGAMKTYDIEYDDEDKKETY